MTRISLEISKIKFELLATKALLEMNRLALNYLQILEELSKKREPLAKSVRQRYIEANKPYVLQINAATTVFPSLYKKSQLIGGDCIPVPLEYDASVYNCLTSFQASCSPVLRKKYGFLLFSQIMGEIIQLPKEIQQLEVKLQQVEQAEKERMRLMDEEVLQEFERFHQAIEEEERNKLQQALNREALYLHDVSGRFSSREELDRIISLIEEFDTMPLSASEESLPSGRTSALSTSSGESFSTAIVGFWQTSNQPGITASDLTYQMLLKD